MANRLGDALKNGKRQNPAVGSPLRGAGYRGFSLWAFCSIEKKGKEGSEV